MIEDYSVDLAKQMGIGLSNATIRVGYPPGSHDVYLLDLSSKGHQVSTRISQSDLDNLLENTNCDQLELKVRSALSRLQMLLEP